MTQTIVFLAASLLVSVTGAAAQSGGIDTKLAAQYFRQLKETSDRDGGKMWGVPLYGPIMFVDPRTGNVVVIAVPWATHDAILSEIKSLVSGKIVVDAVVPLVPPKVSVVQLPPAGSAGVIAHNTLGEGAKVVSAFHNVAAAKLQSGAEIDCDVLVFGNDREARDAVIELAKALGTRGVDGGPIANSAAAEALTAVLIGINRRYKVPGAGIRITGL